MSPDLPSPCVVLQPTQCPTSGNPPLPKSMGTPLSMVLFINYKLVYKYCMFLLSRLNKMTEKWTGTMALSEKWTILFLKKWTMDNDLSKKWTVDNGLPFQGPTSDRTRNVSSALTLLS